MSSTLLRILLITVLSSINGSELATTSAPVSTIKPNPPVDPTKEPTVEPTMEPTLEPTTQPTAEPTLEPSMYPTQDPTEDPTVDPTFVPTTEPTTIPTSDPTLQPTAQPTADPTPRDFGTTEFPVFETSEFPDLLTTELVESTLNPTFNPTIHPTSNPTFNPTLPPSTSLNPTTAPSPGHTTSYPTAESTITTNCTLILNSSFDELWSFTGNNATTLDRIAAEIIAFALDLSEFSTLSAVEIIVHDVSAGSIIIDYSLESQSEALIDLALDNINHTVSTGSTFEVESSNLTLAYSSNIVITIAPTATPTISPTFGPTLTSIIETTLTSQDNDSEGGGDAAKEDDLFGFATQEFVAVGAAILLFVLCIVGFVMYQRKKQRRRSKAEQSVGLTPYAPSGMSYDTYRQKSYEQSKSKSKRQHSLRSLQKPRTMPVPSGSTAGDMHPDDMGSLNSRNALISVYDEDLRRADTPSRDKSHSKSEVNPFVKGFNMEPIEIEDGDPGTPLKSMLSVYDE